MLDNKLLSIFARLHANGTTLTHATLLVLDDSDGKIVNEIKSHIRRRNSLFSLMQLTEK